MTFINDLINTRIQIDTMIVTFQIICAFTPVLIQCNNRRSIGLLDLNFIYTFIPHKLEFIWNCDFIWPICLFYCTFFLFFFVCLLDSVKKFNNSLSVEITNYWRRVDGIWWFRRIKSTLVQFSPEDCLSRQIKFLLLLFKPIVGPINHIIFVVSEHMIFCEK